MAPCSMASPTTPTRRHCRSIGLSDMRGHSHVPFLGEEAMVTPPPYPTVRSASASGSGSCLAFGGAGGICHVSVCLAQRSRSLRLLRLPHGL